MAVVLAAATGGAALAQDDGGGTAGPLDPRVAPGAPAEAKLVPITPCRIVNTQVGAKLEPGRPVEYRSSTGTAQQGGAASCGIPALATALVLSITAPQAEGNGYLRVGPAGAPVPTATFMNYTAGFNVTNGNTVKVRIGSGHNLRVQPFVARTHLIIDVLGYYVEPRMALVGPDGTLLYGSSVSGVQRTGTGTYLVSFTSSVDSCTYLATPAQYSHGGELAALRAFGSSDQVVVNTAGSNGAPANIGFNLRVDC